MDGSSLTVRSENAGTFQIFPPFFSKYFDFVFEKENWRGNRRKMRTIYFCGSIRAGRQDVELYARMIGKLDSYGKVLTPFVGDSTITVKGSEHSGGDKGIHDRDVELLEKSDGKHRYSVSSSSHFSFTLLVSVILLLPNFLSGGRNSLFCKKNFCNKMETSVNQQLFLLRIHGWTEEPWKPR